MGFQVIFLLLGTIASLQHPARFEFVREQVLSTSPPGDIDRDGISDTLEQELAERFAPVLYYEKDEPNWPTTVELFIPKTSLAFYDENCGARIETLVPQLDR